jgi:hypothetical protein
MDERHRIAFGLVGGAGFFGLLGACFGAVVGGLTWREGRAAGTGLGLAVARAYDRAARTELPRGLKGMIVGAVDGFTFLGVVGLLLSAVAAVYGRLSWEWLYPIGKLLLGLMFGALFFGALAYGMVRGGFRAVAAVFVGGVLGALAGAGLRGADGMLPGTIAGIVLGTAAALRTS